MTGGQKEKLFYLKDSLNIHRMVGPLALSDILFYNLRKCSEARTRIRHINDFFSIKFNAVADHNLRC